MNKESFLRLYAKISVVIGVLVLIFVTLFIATFPPSFSALIETNVFRITLIHSSGDYIILNTPLYAFFLLLVLNVIILIRTGSTKDIEEKPLQTLVFNNIIISMMLIIGQIAFVVMIPSSVNGEVLNRLLFITFHSGIGSAVHVIYLGFILSFAYIGYNLYVVIKTRLPEEEIDEDEIPTVRTVETFEEIEEVVE